MNTTNQEKTFREKIFGSKKIPAEIGSKQEEISEVLKTPQEILVDKKQQQEKLVDEWVAQHNPSYTNEISNIISSEELLLDTSYYKKLADKVIEIGSAGLLCHDDYRLKYLIKKGNLDKSYYEWMFTHSLNFGHRNRSQAEDILKFIIEKKLDRKYFEIFIDQTLKIYPRDDYSKLECLIKLVKTACLHGNITFDDYQNTMLRFIDIPNPRANETIHIIKIFLEHDREVEVYSGILDKIIIDKKLLTHLYFTDIWQKLLEKCNIETTELHDEYKQVIDTCVDDYLEGNYIEIGKIHIKIALDAYKKLRKLSPGLDYNSYYDAIKEAGIQLLISE